MEYKIFYVAVLLSSSFVEVMSNNSPDCPEIYQRFSTSHSYCQPKNQACGILQSKVSPQESDQIVQLHNHYRSVIATQQQGSNGLPPASDMLYMEWDNELAEIAQRRSDQCIYAHDEGNQRRVKNFGVGQNIARMKISGTNVQPPQPDWSGAIVSFFNEIEYFSSDMNCGSNKPKPKSAIGHFTQMIWSRTFRIGCGYTMYKDGNSYIRLYVCNYGPGGNVGGECVYNPGSACSKCPINTQCTADSQYPGLCKRINNEAPYKPIKEPHFFECNFINPSSSDCQINALGDSSWSHIPALGGNYLEIVLQPGQNGTIVFSKSLIPSSGAKSMCAQIRYRKGPNLAKDSQNNVGKALFTVPSYNGWTAVFDLPNMDGDFRLQFTPYSLKMGWKAQTDMKISFAVPNGAAPQFLNIASIVGFNDECKNIEY